MNTKLLYVMAAAALSLCIAAPAAAGSIYASPRAGANLLNKNYSLPVLVKVNAQGKVTSASPAFMLKPKFQRFLQATLNQMITSPAHDGHGHAIASQFVIYLSAKTTPEANGKYDLRFTFVKAVAAPPGPLHWAHLNDGRKLALVGPQDLHLNNFNKFSGPIPGNIPNTRYITPPYSGKR